MFSGTPIHSPRGSIGQSPRTIEANDPFAADHTGSPIARSYSQEIRSMREMGFADAQACLAALKQTEGDVNRAVDMLFTAEKQQQQQQQQPQDKKGPSMSQSRPSHDDPWSQYDQDAATRPSAAEAPRPVQAPDFFDDPFADPWRDAK